MTPDPLFAMLFGDPDVDRHLSASARLQAMLDVEAALAEVEAELGIVPRACMAPIRAAAQADRFDLEAIANEAADAGNLAIPLVRHLTRLVDAADRDAARYVHWGATSQDVIDTGLVLQLQRAVPPIVKQLERTAAAAAEHARRHLGTVMAGRTWLQQATPITFGLKAAGWLDAVDRHRGALEACLDEALLLQFGGAAGTLAALGDRGPEVADLLAKRLGLKSPDLPWHARRDRVARLACELGLTCGTLGKIGRDISLLAQTEVGEAVETRERGGGSSTMPHKRNPVGASVVLAAAVRAPGLVATMIAAMPQEHERGLGGWQAEWETLPELVRVTAGAARAAANALSSLAVDIERMRENLELTGGLIASESIAMALAPQLGRAEAHRLVEDATRRAREKGEALAETLATDAAVTRHLDRQAIERHLMPEHYLGAARTFIERVLTRWTST